MEKELNDAVCPICHQDCALWRSDCILDPVDEEEETDDEPSED